jgi:hypothetical protein
MLFSHRGFLTNCYSSEKLQFIKHYNTGDDTRGRQKQATMREKVCLESKASQLRN